MISRSDFDIFDRNPDPALDELVELAAVLSGADYAYLGWMDFNRLWFKAKFGFNGGDIARSATACHWIVETGRPLQIDDASEDPRFPPNGLELPGAKSSRSYAGTPLMAENQQVVGTLAVLSRNPNQFRKEHLILLEVLSRQIITRLELYSRIRAQEQAQRARQRTERALAMERCFVAATLDSIPSLVVVVDTAGRIVRFNEPCAHLTGLTLAGAAGQPFVEELLEISDRPWAVSKLIEAAGGKVSGPHENSWRVAGGLTRRVSWTLQPLKGPNGDIQYLIVTGQDVTGQRQAEMALLTSETRYQRVVESSLGFVFTCTMEGRLTSLNSFTAETLGYRAGNLTGRLVSEFLDAQGAAIFDECLHTLENKEEWQGTLPVRRSDGEFRQIAFRSRRVDLHGERPFVLSHGVDITEQYEAEAELHLVMRQRELILESVGEGIFGIDLGGRITFINPAGAQTLGYKPEELTGSHMLDLVRHSQTDGTPYTIETSPILDGMRKRENVRMRDQLFWRQNGTAIPVEYTANPLVEDGQIAGMVIAFQDITERRRLEKMKDEFISTVSHELRTPLTSLRASLGLVASGSLEKRPEKQRQMVEMAIGNCDRLVRLVNGILDFDKVEKGRLPLFRAPVEAVDLLRRAADVAHSAATEAQITFRIDAVPVVVIADEDRVLQVLGELVSNAIKFSPPGTLIRLGAQPADNDEVSFYVEDQGRGVDSEKLEHIFDRFQQGDASDSRALGGTGLGLALCRSIVEQHGGHIWAESSPGRGSRFLFTLPATDAR